jgi:hypothetical protein
MGSPVLRHEPERLDGYPAHRGFGIAFHSFSNQTPVEDVEHVATIVQTDLANHKRAMIAARLGNHLLTTLPGPVDLDAVQVEHSKMFGVGP